MAALWCGLCGICILTDLTLINPGFFSHFEAMYGERWQPLLTALLNKENHKTVRLPCHYVLDRASVIAARALEAHEGDRVLDMCAAPGGKTLVLASALEIAGSLVSNELSRQRRERLKKVIQQYVPMSVRPRIFVTGKDAIRFGLLQKNTYDKVLLDAPCSGERHLLMDETEFKKWSPKRSENLSRKQYALLCSALLTVKPGGTILYSTCSISPVENDGVIKRLFKKKSGQIELDISARLTSIQGVEQTEFGVMMLPDRFEGGPIYAARLRKR